jgi:hypothetical protein
LPLPPCIRFAALNVIVSAPPPPSTTFEAELAVTLSLPGSARMHEVIPPCAITSGPAVPVMRGIVDAQQRSSENWRHADETPVAR